MALQACRECGSMVSTEAVSCPQCGVPRPTAPPPGTQAVAGRVPGSFAAPDTMTSHENPIYRARMHWSIYSHALLAGILAVPAYVLVNDILGIALGVATLGLAAVAYIRGSSTEFVITTRRLIAKRGIVSRRTIETLLEKVEAVSVEQGLLGRMLNYGTVTVQGTGGTRESFAMVSDPMQLRKVIHEQIDTLRPVGMVMR